MRTKHQLIFVQGGGKGVHDDWDNQLVASLRKALGPQYEVHYPRMPHEEDPKYPGWKTALEKAFDALPDGAVFVAHSLGATILLKALTERASASSVAGVFLISAPFVGKGGWSDDELKFPRDLGGALPKGVPIHFFHGLEDETAPPSHVELYAHAVPQAHIHRLRGRDHQLNNDLTEVAAAIAALETPR